jgi:hypothetical protein
MAARRKVLAGSIVILLGLACPVLLVLYSVLFGSVWGVGFVFFAVLFGPVAFLGLLIAPGWYVVRSGLKMPRVYRVTCELCGCVLYVAVIVARHPNSRGHLPGA